MHRLLLLPVVVLALAAASPTSAGTSTQSAVTVRITSTGFDPATVSVQNGDEITWTNTDTAPRQVVADDGSFKSDVLAPGQSFTHAFSDAGTFGYHGGIKTSHRGAVSVKLTRTVSLNNVRSAVTYVHSVKFTGTISDAVDGEQVVIESKPAGTDTFDEIARTSTFTGHWQVTVRPRRNTEYRAVWHNVYSNVDTVNVRPFLRLKRTGRASVRAYAHADGVRIKKVTLQRWSRHRGWRTIRGLRLRRLRTLPMQEWMSFGNFHLRFRHGTILRIRVTRAQAGPVMYGPAVSNSIRI